jgi:host factor-I protein
MSQDKHVNVQDAFLNHVRKNKTPLTVFLINGVKLQGTVSWFDSCTILLRREGHCQLIYKKAISTLMPHGPVQLFDVAGGSDGSVSQSDEEEFMEHEELF